MESNGSGSGCPAAITAELAARYLDLLGQSSCRSFHIHTRVGWRSGWGEAPSLIALANALGGRYALALNGLTTTRVVVLDLDVGHEVHDARELQPAVAPWQPEREPHEAFVRRTGRKDSIRARMRHHVADMIFVWLEQLRTARIPFCVVSTPRGAHVVIRLPEDLSIDRAHALGQAIRRKFDRRSTEPVEVFPALDGRMCRLPLTGTTRLVSAESGYERFAHGRRMQDILALFELAPLSAPMVRRLLARAPRSPGKSIAPPRTRSCNENSRPAGRGGRSDGQLFGRDFANEVVRTFLDGMGRGESYDVARRWSFALRVSCGLSSEESERVFATWLSHDDHRARHAMSTHGRRDLMATFRACVARHGHGIAQGTLHPGRLRDRRVLEIVAYLQRVAAGDATVVRPVPSRERGGHRISRAPIPSSVRSPSSGWRGRNEPPRPPTCAGNAPTSVRRPMLAGSLSPPGASAESAPRGARASRPRIGALDDGKALLGSVQLASDAAGGPRRTAGERCLAGFAHVHSGVAQGGTVRSRCAIVLSRRRAGLREPSSASLRAGVP